MKQIEQQPTLEIKCPNGEIIRVFQELSPEYMKELIEAFMECKRSKKQIT